MGKKMRNILIALVIGFQLFPITVYGKGKDAFLIYQEAMQKTVASRNWKEELDMDADMTIIQGKAKTKTKVTLDAVTEVSDYDENDSSAVQMTGSASMAVLGQTYIWNMTYRDGKAHYEYKEPVSKTVDVEMNPNYFQFTSLTQNMMKRGKISGDEITFTIPAEKANEIGIAAAQMIDGVENLKYSDVEVKINIDETTGKIDEILMDFQASMQYQGYNADMQYTVKYKFLSLDQVGAEETEQQENEERENTPEDGLAVYSDYTSLSICKDNSITLSAGIFNNGELMDDVSGITFWVDDSSVLELKKTGVADKRRYTEWKGIQTGTAHVFFQDTNTGYMSEIPVTVYQGHQYSYTVNTVPVQYIEKEYATNIYNMNGLYIDNYTYEINKDNRTASVSFDVYNSSYIYGSVETYDEKGHLKDVVLIKKMSSGNTSMKGALWDNTSGLISDLKEGTIGSYRQKSGFSKKTSVKVEIPKEGYIKISNDPQDSAVVNIINSADLLIGFGKLAKTIKNFDVDSEVFSEALTKKLLESKAFVTLIEDGSELPQNLCKGVSDKVFFSTESLGSFSETIIKNLNEFDLMDVIEDTAKDFGVSIGEKMFHFVSGPAGKALDAIFAMGKFENEFLQHMNFVRSQGVGSVYIQNQKGFRSSQQIKVESKNGFSDETSLRVFKVELDSEKLEELKKTNLEVYNAIKDRTSYTYNISLMESGEEIQPEENVQVYIPIPEKMKLFAYLGKTKIYRVEADGTLTEMDVKIKNGGFTFETSHFSVYTLIEESLKKEIMLVVLSALLFAGVLIYLRKRRKNKL